MGDTTFNDAIRRLAREMPGHIAYRTPARDWTYAEVDQATNRMANALASLGIGAGHRVACLTLHVAECTLLVLAAAKIGAVCMPVNWRLAPAEVDYILKHGQARLVMADEQFLPALFGLELPVVSASDPDHAAAPHDTALQLYSSGTTGLPKGVELSHINLIGVCETIRGEYNYSEGNTVTLNAAPTFHIGGLGMSFVALYNGSMTVSYPDFEAARVIAAFAEHCVTHTFVVPAMIQLMLQTPGVERADFASLRLIGYGASPISEKTLVDAIRVFKCRFVQNYGLTETTGTIVCLPPEDHAPGTARAHLLRAAGRPCGGIRLRVMDAATGRDMPEGEVGEVWIHSKQNMKRYWRNEAATREAYPEGRRISNVRARSISWMLCHGIQLEKY